MISLNIMELLDRGLRSLSASRLMIQNVKPCPDMSNIEGTVS